MSSPSFDVSGPAIVTADGVLGTSGAPTRVFCMHIISGATAGVVQLRNGTAVTDTIWVKETGTVSTGKTVSFGDHGQLFPAGCYVDVDANVTSVVFDYSQ